MLQGGRILLFPPPNVYPFKSFTMAFVAQVRKLRATISAQFVTPDIFSIHTMSAIFI